MPTARRTRAGVTLPAGRRGGSPLAWWLPADNDDRAKVLGSNRHDRDRSLRLTEVKDGIFRRQRTWVSILQAVGPSDGNNYSFGM